MTFARKRVTAFAALAVAAAVALTGCAGSGDSGDGGEGGGDSSNLAITFLPKNLGNPYFDTSSEGGKKAVEEFGGTFAEVGPAEATPDAQVSYINTARSRVSERSSSRRTTRRPSATPSTRRATPG